MEARRRMGRGAVGGAAPQDDTDALRWRLFGGGEAARVFASCAIVGSWCVPSAEPSTTVTSSVDAGNISSFMAGLGRERKPLVTDGGPDREV